MHELALMLSSKKQLDYSDYIKLANLNNRLVENKKCNKKNAFDF